MTDKQDFFHLLGTLGIVLFIITIACIGNRGNEKHFKQYSMVETRVLNHLNYKDKNPEVYISPQICEYFDMKGFACPWDTDIAYKYIRNEKDENGNTFLIVKKDPLSEEKRIDFQSIRLKKQFLGFKYDNQYGCPPLDRYGTNFNEFEEYQFFDNGENRIFIDDQGNQVVE